MLKKLHKKYKSSVLNKSILALKNNPKLMLLILLLDICFLAVFYLVNLLINKLIPTAPETLSKIQQDTILLVAVAIIFVMYFVILLLAYSFFSLIILGNIKKMSTDHTHDFKMLKNMFVINLLLFVVFFLLLVLFNVLTPFIMHTNAWLSLLSSSVFIIIGFVVYAFYNFMHSAFILQHELKANLKKSLKHIFTRSYLGVFLFSFIVIAFYVLIYVLFGMLFKDFIVKNYSMFLNVSSVLTIVLVYVLFSFNRVYFFFVAEKHIGHKRNQ